MKQLSVVTIVALLLFLSATVMAQEPNAPAPPEPEPVNGEPVPAEPVAAEPEPEPAVEEPITDEKAETEPTNDTLMTSEPEPAAAVEADSCTTRCQATCGCWFERGGGGPFVMILFNEYDNKWGQVDGPSFYFGGRGYFYLGKNSDWRLGGMGAGGFMKDNEDVQTGDGLFGLSSDRSVGGGFGGLTAEYVFNANSTVEFPLGVMVGGGGAEYSSTLPENTDVLGIQTQYKEDAAFFAFMPMIGAEANLVEWMRVTVTMSYMLTEGSGPRLLDGFSVMLGLGFGHFKTEEFKLAEADVDESEKAAK